MIDTPIHRILDMVRSGRVISEKAFATVDLSEALSVRECDSYRYYFQNELHDRWRILPLHEDLRLMHDELRDLVTETSSTRIRSSIKGMESRDADTLVDTLSSRIAQELTNIAKSRATLYEKDWYDQLWIEYKADRIPMIVADEFVNPHLSKKAC